MPRRKGSKVRNSPRLKAFIAANQDLEKIKNDGDSFHEVIRALDDTVILSEYAKPELTRIAALSIYALSMLIEGENNEQDT